MAAWAAAAALGISILLSMSTWFAAAAILPALRLRWDLSAGTSAWLTIAVQIGFVCGALCSAVLNIPDRLPPRYVFTVTALGAAAVNALLVVVPNSGAAILLRFLTGACIAGVYPPALKQLATWFQRGRGLALGMIVGALTLGSALPYLLNALGGARWENVVLASSVLTLIGGIVQLTFVRDGPYQFPRAAFNPRHALLVFRDRSVLLANLGYFGHMWELYAMWSWFLIFAAADFTASGNTGPDSRSTAALATFVVIGVGAAGCIFGGIAGDRWGRTRTTAIAMVVSGFCALTIGATLGRSPALMLIVGVIWGVAVVADSAQFSTMVTELANQAYVGSALTMQLAVGFSLTVATIWLIPVVYGRWGWSYAFCVLAAGPACGVVAMVMLRRRPDSVRIAHGLR